MKASDVMTRDVVCVYEDTPVEEIARLMLRNGISGVPVTDREGMILGIVSEGDLLRRPEIDTDYQRPASVLRSLFEESDAGPRAFVRSHGHRASDVMSANPLTVHEDTSLREVAALLEKHRIKRVPVVQDRQVVGIVSRANLVQALAAVSRHVPEPPKEDRALRDRILQAIQRTGVPTSVLNVIVWDGGVEVWGTVDSEVEHEAVRLAVEEVIPAERVTYRLGRLPAYVRAMMWGT